jgi:hypothetical protein
MRWLACSMIALAMSGCGEDDPAGGICDAETLRDALTAAAPGSTVRMGACRVNGGFSIPPGVTLAGSGAESVVVVERGMGLGLGVRAGLAALTVEGPVTTANADMIPPGPSGEETATVGIGAVDADEVTLDDVTVRGFARLGVLLHGTSAQWNGGAVDANLGTGVMIAGSTAEGAPIVSMDGVRICGTMRGLQVASYGLVVSAGAEVHTRDVEICDGQAFGILQDSADVTHDDLVATGNDEPAIWVQGASTLTVTGTATMIADNGLAGIVAVGSPALMVTDARIEATRLGSRVGDGGTGTIMVGDGMHLVVDDDARIDVRGTSFAGNARLGILLDVPGSAPPTETMFEDVTVDSSEGAFGAILQNAGGPITGTTWDGAITRSGSAAAVDPTVTDSFSVFGAVAPMFIPRPD